ncbi:hypothetical protein ABPG72_004879 [Tetrahymena utriculariae]
MFQNYGSNSYFRETNSDKGIIDQINIKKPANFLLKGTLKLDFSSHNQQNLETINGMFKEVSYSNLCLIRLQLILYKVTHNQIFFQLMSKLRCVEQVDIICQHENSLDLAFLILEALSRRNVKELAFNLKNVSINQPAYHIKILRVLKNMEELGYLKLSFNENEQVPQLKPLKTINSVKILKLEGGKKIYDYYLTLFPNLETIQLKPDKIQFKLSNNLVNRLENLKELTIQSINFIRLNNLINLQKLTLTENFTGFTYFDDFKYLQNLQKLIILPQLDYNGVNWLLQIPFVNKGCILEIKTLYYCQLISLGENKNIFLKINQSDLCTNNSPQILQSYKYWGGIRNLQNLISLEQDICHGEKFSDHEITKFIENITFYSHA